MIKDRTGDFLPVFVPVMALAVVGLVVSVAFLRPESPRPKRVPRQSGT
jgi:hypothetical protein